MSKAENLLILDHGRVPRVTGGQRKPVSLPNFDTGKHFRPLSSRTLSPTAKISLLHASGYSDLPQDKYCQEYCQILLQLRNWRAFYHFEKHKQKSSDWLKHKKQETVKKILRRWPPSFGVNYADSREDIGGHPYDVLETFGQDNERSRWITQEFQAILGEAMDTLSPEHLDLLERQQADDAKHLRTLMDGFDQTRFPYSEPLLGQDRLRSLLQWEELICALSADGYKWTENWRYVRNDRSCKKSTGFEAWGSYYEQSLAMQLRRFVSLKEEALKEAKHWQICWQKFTEYWEYHLSKRKLHSSHLEEVREKVVMGRDCTETARKEVILGECRLRDAKSAKDAFWILHSNDQQEFGGQEQGESRSETTHGDEKVLPVTETLNGLGVSRECSTVGEGLCPIHEDIKKDERDAETRDSTMADAETKFLDISTLETPEPHEVESSRCHAALDEVNTIPEILRVFKRHENKVQKRYKRANTQPQGNRNVRSRSLSPFKTTAQQSCQGTKPLRHRSLSPSSTPVQMDGTKQLTSLPPAVIEHQQSEGTPQATQAVMVTVNNSGNAETSLRITSMDDETSEYKSPKITLIRSRDDQAPATPAIQTQHQEPVARILPSILKSKKRKSDNIEDALDFSCKRACWERHLPEPLDSPPPSPCHHARRVHWQDPIADFRAPEAAVTPNIPSARAIRARIPKNGIKIHSLLAIFGVRAPTQGYLQAMLKLLKENTRFDRVRKVLLPLDSTDCATRL